MLNPDVRQMLQDPDIGGGEPFVIVRKTTTRQKGETVAASVERINATGTLQPAGNDALQQLPEADRSGEVLIVRSPVPLQMGSTKSDGEILADEIEYAGRVYKILQLRDWRQWGMWAAYVTKVGDVVGP